jgi:hypothetical protein
MTRNKFMYSKELNERNPLRLFEHSIHGGVGPGNIGVVVARHGIGKTAFLVGIAIDDAIRGRSVLHVSLDKTVDHMREFYDEIFTDLSHSAGLEDLALARLDMERHRMIHTYAGGTFTTDKLRHSMEFLKDVAHFDPACLILEGYAFEHATPADIAALRQLASDFKVELWMSAVTHRGVASDDRGIPEPLTKLASEIAVIVQMKDDNGTVKLSLLKDHDNPDVAKLTVALDPSTMLLVKK